MPVHVPILVQPIVEALVEPLRSLAPGAEPRWLVDCTLGGGGHTAALLGALDGDARLARHQVLALDQDASAVERAQERFGAEVKMGRLELRHARFGEAAGLLEGRLVGGLMADLGFSSDQLEDPERGLSFGADGPLDMRLDRSRGRGARDLLLQSTEHDLERLLSEWGEERFARRIAGAIVTARREKRLPDTARGLAGLIEQAVPPPARHGRIHAATRAFQAIRIAVNDELGELDRLLSRVILSVEPGGRVAILSFHSLEDRKVKQAFRGEGFRQLGKKPIEADAAELAANPRARSAKLRVAERTGASR